QRLRAAGKPGSVVAAAVANRWIRRLYHEMKTPSGELAVAVRSARSRSEERRAGERMERTPQATVIPCWCWRARMPTGPWARITDGAASATSKQPTGARLAPMLG